VESKCRHISVSYCQWVFHTPVKNVDSHCQRVPIICQLGNCQILGTVSVTCDIDVRVKLYMFYSQTFAFPFAQDAKEIRDEYCMTRRDFMAIPILVRDSSNVTCWTYETSYICIASVMLESIAL
jgi:hypothetical protein